MIKISCFMQNQCISGVPQGIPMQFFAQVMLFDQFQTYSQWFAQNLIFKYFNSWNVLKMLKISCFMQNQCISGMPQCIHMQFFAQQW